MTRARLARACLAFGFAAPLAYVLQRLLERATGVPVDPLAVVREVHTAYYWRCFTAVFWGGVAAFVVYGWPAADGTAGIRRLVFAGGVWALFVAVASWGWP
ncbi:MAG: hypothetical protein H6721_16255 [Sandaracinus sp.]|nr:hypothetical protein [Sandaracinus sp.]MCB9614380.1 hypothetical protein [Sandaracinus sp.]MCB9633671.1 hypothetical protein [Sandaracinus sp.]